MAVSSTSSTSSTTSASSIASNLGIGSGVDMTGIANQLAQAQFAPQTQRLTDQSEKLKSQISLAGSIRSALSQFASALGDRVRTGDLAPKPSISNEAVATVTSPLGLTGKGSYSLEVTQLASNQTLASAAFSSPTASVGSGTLTIRFGRTTATSFTPGGQPDVAVDVPAGSTLSDVATAINAKHAGVTAYVAQTAAGAQLVFKGQEGATNGFVIDAAETAGDPGLSGLAWTANGDPQRLVAQSQDAQFKFDGLQRTSATNTVASVAPGVSLTLTGTNVGAPATISFSKPGAAIGIVMQDMVSALNEISGQLRTATDPMTGDLARDSGARGLVRSFASLGSKIIMPSAPAGTPRTLTELGLATQRDGTFTFDAAKLASAMDRDPDAVAAMFTNGLNGVFAEIDKLSRSTTIATDPGTLGGSIARYQAQSTKIATDLSDLADKQEKFRFAMVTRFAKADSQVAASKSTLAFLQAQVNAWNAQRN